MNSKVARLQEAMLEMPQAEVKTTHSFCNGVYAREITIPKGGALVGAKHKTAFFMVISKGKCAIIDKTEEIFKAPCTIVSQAGAKRAIYALEETVLTTFHVTDETDIMKIEHEIIQDEGLKIANSGRVSLSVG
jgi:hypothetical protein